MNMGGRAYPVRHYPIAIRLRDREGRAVLCLHYFLSIEAEKQREYQNADTPSIFWFI